MLRSAWRQGAPADRARAAPAAAAEGASCLVLLRNVEVRSRSADSGTPCQRRRFDEPLNSRVELRGHATGPMGPWDQRQSASKAGEAAARITDAHMASRAPQLITPVRRQPGRRGWKASRLALLGNPGPSPGSPLGRPRQRRQIRDLGARAPGRPAHRGLRAPRASVHAGRRAAAKSSNTRYRPSGLSPAARPRAPQCGHNLGPCRRWPPH